MLSKIFERWRKVEWIRIILLEYKHLCVTAHFYRVWLQKLQAWITVAILPSSSAFHTVVAVLPKDNTVISSLYTGAKRWYWLQWYKNFIPCLPWDQTSNKDRSMHTIQGKRKSKSISVTALIRTATDKSY